MAAFRAQRADGGRYSAKYPFPTRGGHEHIWLAVTAISDPQVTGRLDNDPDQDVGHKRGETVTVPSKDISDWLYEDSGTEKLVGGFTIKVLAAREKRH